MTDMERAREIAAGLSDEDRKHVFHAWMQAEDGDGIHRPHIDTCVQLGAMEQTADGYWEFTDHGAAVADAIYALWSNGEFNQWTGALARGED